MGKITCSTMVSLQFISSPLPGPSSWLLTLLTMFPDILYVLFEVFSLSTFRISKYLVLLTSLWSSSCFSNLCLLWVSLPDRTVFPFSCWFFRSRCETLCGGTACLWSPYLWELAFLVPSLWTSLVNACFVWVGVVFCLVNLIFSLAIWVLIPFAGTGSQVAACFHHLV